MSQPAAKPEDPSFEDAMARLEGIVEAMESGKLPLEQMLEQYEQGSRLVRLCTGKLAAAEQRIELIARNAEGTVETTAFDPSAKPEEPAAPPPRRTRAATPPPKEDNDVSLF